LFINGASTESVELIVRKIKQSKEKEC
jgi:hypothetical protein